MTISMDVQEIILMDMTTTALITLDIAAPASAGLIPVNDTTMNPTTVRLRYTSCVPVGQTRRIEVSYADAIRPPAGTELRVYPTMVSNVGTAAATVGAPLTISGVAQNLIVAIGSCNTGTAATNGPRIRYVFAVANASQLIVDSTTVTVAYTITDAS